MNKFYNICVISLGCEKNRYDTEAALAILISAGHKVVYEYEDSDIVIINTCSFIASAREETKDNINEALKYKKLNPNLKIIVCGCYPQKFEKELLELYGSKISAYCGIEMHKYISEIIDNIESYKSFIEKPNDKWYEPEMGRINTLANYTANLKIAEGCNNRCSYCAIPSIRGNLRSRPIDYILQEAESLNQMGIKEINIIAQDITAYGKDLNYHDALPELLYKLNDINGSVEWIRLLYAYPTEISDNLIKAIKNCKKIVPYLDIPLQHGDNQVLKDMNRRGTAEEYLETIYKLRDEIPNITLRSTFIVGYPTETDQAFDNLIEFVKKANFDRAGFFVYSKEINTPAYSIENKIDSNVINERAKILGELLEKLSFKKNKTLINTKTDVLCEYKEKNYIYGRTLRDAIDIDGIIKIKSRKNLVGKILKDIQIIDADIFDLKGIYL